MAASLGGFSLLVSESRSLRFPHVRGAVVFQIKPTSQSSKSIHLASLLLASLLAKLASRPSACLNKVSIDAS